MLSDIARVALAIGQDLFGGAGFLSDLDIASAPPGVVAGNDDPCPRERLAFLQQAWPSLASALARIEAAPAARIIAQTRFVPVERARRVTPQALLAALRASSEQPRHIEETVAAPLADTPHNRAVAACLAVWARDLETIVVLANALDAPNVAREAAHLRARVLRHGRREPWQSLLPASGGATHLSAAAVLQSPTAPALYRFIGDTFLRYRRAFAFCWENPLFTLAARDAWLLYECWTLFQAAAALRTLGLRAIRADGWALNRAGLTFTLAPGTASRIRFAPRPGEGGPTVTMGYNVLFPSGNDAPPRSYYTYYTRSHAMRPDIVLQRGGDGRLLIFDAKFKSYAEPERMRTGEHANLPLVHDINQAHAYRDAIRHGAAAHAVDAAWLLYAGRRNWPNRPVIAYPPTSAASPFGDGEVGALLLRPGCATSRSGLQALIAAFLEPGR